ncbi:diguanylate cyclase [candidate division TA06 bacterium]|nr:diguanylate cyclase [candidate division TA06 bacterium]
MIHEITKILHSYLESNSLQEDEGKWNEGLKKGMEKVAEQVGAEAWTLSFVENAFPIQIGKGIVGEVAREGKSPIAADWNENPKLFQEIDRKIHSHLQSFLVCPLQIQGRTAGILQVINKTDSPSFTEEDLFVLSPIADYISLFLENRILLKTYNRKMEELSLLTEVGRAISSFLDLPNLLEQSIHLIRKRFHYYYVAIFLREKDQDRVTLRAFSGAPGVEPVRRSLGIGREGIIGWSTRTGQSLMVSDVTKEERYLHGVQGVRSEMVVPIKREKEILGVLDIGSDKTNSFKEEDLRMMNQLTRQLAIAIENARLVQQVEELAIIDDVTHLYNTRYCNLYLEKAVARGEVVSVIFLDLDFFKRVDDAYGHRIGALTLREVANRIKEGVRKEDICSRYGGDEYVIILPGTSLEESTRLAQNLKTSFEERLFWIENRIPLSITASFGVATFPNCAKSSWELLVKADQAMYQVKTSGRNDVAVAEEK